LRCRPRNAPRDGHAVCFESGRDARRRRLPPR
jgi:hypothetical protein